MHSNLMLMFFMQSVAVEKREHVAGNDFNGRDNCLAQKTQVSNRCDELLKVGRTTLVMRMLTLKPPLLSANKPDRQEGFRSGYMVQKLLPGHKRAGISIA